MASQFLTALSLLALTGCCLGGFAATYSGFHPGYATYQSAPAVYHAAPAAVYQQAVAAPVLAKSVLPVAPVYAKSYAVPTPFVKAVAPVATYAAAPALVKTVAAAPLAPVVKQVELESSPRYDFSYGVHDSLTGDIKSQVESRDGGNVVGSYSVLDADGYKRTVTYTADDINGFNAVVQRVPLVAARALPVPVAPAVAAAPVAHLPAPIYYPQAQQQLFQPQQQQLFQPQQQQVNVEQESEVVEAPRQPEQEPAPVDYSDVQQQQQQVYPQDQQFPPYPSASPAPVDDSDSDVVEARSAQESGSTTAAPAAVEEGNQKNQDNKSA
ncbi:RNA polymerase II degradation factor 1 [Drosophila hydei]|uniref:RNA polymerase II degradation factor 1 n=1 Tax=Drosophila hydei TaxID=7224 RepID=A0A6J1MKQ2_DROHY|nr:RNA polymerase II degradation factor 1 [Drosophila hydei]